MKIEIYLCCLKKPMRCGHNGYPFERHAFFVSFGEDLGMISVRRFRCDYYFKFGLKLPPQTKINMNRKFQPSSFSSGSEVMGILTLQLPAERSFDSKRGFGLCRMGLPPQAPKNVSIRA